MSLQALWNLFQAHPGRIVNDLALFSPWRAAGCCWRPVAANVSPSRAWRLRAKSLR
jgi:hypothetical protein